MKGKTQAALTAEAVTATLAAIGVTIEPSRAAGAAATLEAQVSGLARATAAVAFETEPATYLKVSAREKP